MIFARFHSKQFCYINSELHNDPEIVLQAIRRWPPAYCSAGTTCKQTPKIVLATLRAFWDIPWAYRKLEKTISSIPDSLKENLEIKQLINSHLNEMIRYKAVENCLAREPPDFKLARCITFDIQNMRLQANVRKRIDSREHPNVIY